MPGCTYRRGSDEEAAGRRVFGPGRAVPLDGNTKARIAAYAKAWERSETSSRASTRARSPATFLEVLEALLWGFHNSRSWCLLPRPTRRLPPRRSAIAAQRGGGAEGAGVGWRAHLAEPDHFAPWCDSATCSAAGRSAGQ